MKDYLHYEPEDFAQDDYFISWVSSAEFETEAFWQSWLETYPFKRQDVEIARQLVLLTLQLPSPQVTDSEIKGMKESVFGRIESLEKSTSGFSFFRTLYYWPAAAMISGIMLLGGWYWFGKKAKPVASYAHQITEAAETYELIEVGNSTKSARLINLPDGSSVILKKGSKLSYPRSFKEDIREIFLSGEAFFEISKDANRPFYVYANEIVTKVLGTSFNVKAYPADPEICVTVKTGKVSVYRSGTSEAEKQLDSKQLEGLVLAPNQQAIFEKGKVALNKRVLGKDPLTVEPVIAQMNFEFEEVPVQEIFRRLENAYQIKIVYDRSVIGKCPVTASLTDEPLYDKLSLICKAVRARYEWVNGEIIITGKGCE